MLKVFLVCFFCCRNMKSDKYLRLNDTDSLPQSDMYVLQGSGYKPTRALQR